MNTTNILIPAKHLLVGLIGLVCSMLLPLAASAQEIEKLAWMNGIWTQTKEGEVVQESWLGPRGKTMVGGNLTTSARRGTSFEFLRIVEGTDGLVYYGSPEGKTPTPFKLKQMGDKRVVFENPTHDFPQRIIYWLEPDGAMKARIEGQVKGKDRGIEWRFEPVKP